MLIESTVLMWLWIFWYHGLILWCWITVHNYILFLQSVINPDVSKIPTKCFKIATTWKQLYYIRKQVPILRKNVCTKQDFLVIHNKNFKLIKKYQPPIYLLIQKSSSSVKKISKHSHSHIIMRPDKMRVGQSKFEWSLYCYTSTKYISFSEY